MTNDDVRRSMTRIADARLARRAELAIDASAPASAADRPDATLRAGDRVLDVRGGREGAVSNVGPADARGAFLVYVRFDDGAIGARDPWDLIRRPTPPAGRS